MPDATMTDVTNQKLQHLPPASARLGRAVARPRAVAIACVVALTGLGWLYLGVMQAQQSDFLAALCRPVAAGAPQWRDAVLILAMWSAMALAMMLPSAAPMILTYAEIADAAARKREPIVSPFVLATGYLAAWLAFAVAATITQVILSRFAVLDSSTPSVGQLLSGALFLGAGLYQFSTLKQACLRQCRAPFQFFFTNWQTTPRGVFRLGVRQGLYCLGCCWAAMALMFALGVMNVLWMALVGAVMTIEKLASGPRLSYAIGAMLIAVGLIFFAMPGVGIG